MLERKPRATKKRPVGRFSAESLAEWTGLEPATPDVTGRYSNQLNYHSFPAAKPVLALQQEGRIISTFAARATALLHALEDARRAHAGADAHGHHAVFQLGIALKSMHQRGRADGTGGA